MNHKRVKPSGGKQIFCLSMLVALGAQASLFATAATIPSDGGSASIDGFEVVCGKGLSPLVMVGDLRGVLDKITFSGGSTRFALCGYATAGSAPSLTKASERSPAANATTYITNRDGLYLSCMNGNLPFVLIGTAEGSLNTSKGLVMLHGDNNEIAVCLSPAKVS